MEQYKITGEPKPLTVDGLRERLRTQAEPSGSKLPPISKPLVLVVVIGVLGLAFIVWFLNRTVNGPLQEVLQNPSNQVVKANAHFDGLDSTTLVFDINEISGTASRLDVFRCFLQYADAMKNRHFSKVILATRGANKFTLDGSYFQQLGQEYRSQNPMYTIRTFPAHLTAMDGTKPFSEYSGGMLGVLQKELEQFSEFSDQWYFRSTEVFARDDHDSPPKVSGVGSTPEADPSSDDNWRILESTNEMDNTPEVSLRKSGTDGATLIIRCAKRKTEIYVNTDVVLQDEAVRVRFDDSAPIRQYWGKSTDDKALFAPDAISFARRLANTRTFRFEFTPFEEREKTVIFDVSGLDSKLEKVSDTCDWTSIDRNRARAKAADAASVARFAEFVHECQSPGGGWCWSDPADSWKHETYGGETREAPIRSAIEWARDGLGFKGVKP